jgi:hypothetical protein
MQRKLPRELRNMVYSYLVKPDYDLSSFDPSDFDPIKRKPYIHIPIDNDNHWLYPEMVGPETAVEITQAFFEYNSFDIDWRCIKQFMNKAFRAGVLPRDFVNGSLKIYMDEDMEYPEEFQSLRQQLNELLSLRRRPAIILHIDALPGCDDIVLHFLKIIRPIFFKLLEKQFQVEIVLETVAKLRLNDVIKGDTGTWRAFLQLWEQEVSYFDGHATNGY